MVAIWPAAAFGTGSTWTSALRAPSESGLLRPEVARLAAAVIDRPPPPADLEEGDGNETFEVRFVSDEERLYYVKAWLLMASAEEKAMSKSVLGFRNQGMYAGRRCFCVGVFLNGRLQSLATCEEKSDITDIISFFVPGRVLRCLAMLSKPRIKSPAGELLVRALAKLAKDTECRADFEPLKGTCAQRYYVIGATLGLSP